MDEIRKFLDKLKNGQQRIKPLEIAQSCRNLLFNAVKSIFAKKGEEVSSKASLLELLDSPTVNEYLSYDADIVNSLHYIRILGSSAKQGLSVKKTESELAAKNLEYFNDYCEWKEQNISGSDVNSYPKMPYMSEANTRKLYIDLYLKEAGWDVMEKENIPSHSKAGIEIEVEGMPNSKGLGYCDYVLYGKDGRPLAIVEAKKTSVEPEKGRHQVELYGECMKAKYGYIPILYYTNGYEIRCIDGIYPPRRLLAFHTESELEVLLQRRSRSDITNIKINDNITNRGYQKQAITAICDRLNKKHRRGLLVMATGTGKTRISISLVDVLARSGWVKSVLFLADRTSLVSQAHSSFKDLLPEFPTCVLSENGKDKNIGARLMFSTYQTMINYIDSEDKIFSTGRFDLILIDEAHRSIFNKYGTIFEYFDSFLIGLTATPKSDVDFNTYRIFNCESGEPNFAYGLEEAVKDKYLVPYRVVNKTTKRLQRGFKYEELLADERRQLEEQYGGIAPTPEFTVSSSKLFREIYNENTCDVVIQELMNNGLKVSQGDLLGKTIIFAYNHKHAQMIVDRFNVLYPRYGSEYCQLIDNYVNYADDLIEKFKVNDNFRIAVSVDMLDTGIDVPSVLNLVFFKPVSSKVKFVQMIGRGTRLCENIFGIGQDKTHFLIFDFCDNFNYFNVHENPPEAKGKQLSISQRLFNLRLAVLCELQSIKHQEIEFNRNYYLKLKDELRSEVAKIKLNSVRIQVREELCFVDKYSDINTWTNISPLMRSEIERHIAYLLDNDIWEDAKIKSFDARMFYAEISMLESGNIKSASAHVRNIMEVCQFLLDEKASIPQVLEKKRELQQLSSQQYWDSPTIESLESLRAAVRELMVFLDSAGNGKKFDVHISDEVIPNGEDTDISIDIRTYKQKVIDYLLEHSNNPIVKKIKNLEKINANDLKELEHILWNELGSKADYEKTTDTENLAVFIRSLVGLEQSAINEKFGDFLSGNVLNPQQQEFVKTIIDYVRENGNIELSDLANTSPFNEYPIIDIFGENITILQTIVKTFNNAVLAA